jgi:transcriptional antiterminator RfaH
MDTRWIVVTTKAGQESWAIENLARQSCQYYFPKITEMIRTRKRRELSIRPLFARHVFVEVDMTKRWKFVTGTLGVRSVIMQGENPGFVPKREIEKLKSLEDQDGMIVLPSLRTFDDNQQVRINGGMLEGHAGLYQGQHSKDREKVLVSLLGRKVSVLIDSRYLEAA